MRTKQGMLKCRQGGGIQLHPCQQPQPVAVAEDEVHEGGIAEDLGKLSPFALSCLFPLFPL